MSGQVTSIPLPPDSFTLLAETLITRGQFTLGHFQGNQKSMNRRLSQAWDDFVPKRNPASDWIRSQDRALWLRYLQGLPEVDDVDSDVIDATNNAAPNVRTDDEYGRALFIHVCTELLGVANINDAIASWNTLYDPEKKVYMMRGKRWDELSRICAVSPADLPKALNVAEFYSYLPRTGITRRGNDSRNHWGF